MTHPELSLEVRMSRAGIPWLVDPITGAQIRPAIVSGGDGPTDEDGDEDESGSGGDDGRTYSKHDLDSIVGRQRRKAEREAEKRIAESLGMTIDEARSFIAERRKADEESMSEADRRRAEADEKIRQAEERERAAARRELSARVEAKLARLGLDEGAIEIVLPSITVDPDADDDDIVAAIESVRAKAPALFTASSSSETGSTPPPSSNGRRDRKPQNGSGSDPVLDRRIASLRQSSEARGNIPTL